MLEEHLARNNICIAIKERLVKDSGVAGEGVYDIIVQKLLSKPRARGKFRFDPLGSMEVMLTLNTIDDWYLNKKLNSLGRHFVKLQHFRYNMLC